MHPPRMSAPSCIVPPTEQLVIRPHIVPLLPTFHGMESENPYGISRNLRRPRSIRTWTDLQAEFLKKFFPTHRTNGLKRQISNFSAKENEKFYECWERYMEAINACPHHGFDTWLLVSYFYDGMSSSMKQLLETMCGGDFMNIDMKAKVAAMARRLEELEMKKIREVQAISETPVQAMCVPFVNLLSTWWRSVLRFQLNHPNFSWKPRAPQYTQPGQAPPQASNLEQAIVNLSKVWETLLETRNPSMLSSVKELTSSEGESSQVREVKAVITLRSGKEVDLPTSKPEHEPESEAEKEKREEIKGKRKGNSAKKEDLESTVNEEPERTINQEDMMKKHTPPPFPKLCMQKGNQ
ncbi:hypothetical protein CK203_060686 [Vitis vinifera]|uniref:Retrotransposon gag domain-containing protein n=1 Tax=Vitis vinifera TaxID=29760 RepID=A0A438GAA3_VITVI|nr:hypothetical protein CK203_060686 [Vitis vinifera]